MKNILFLFVCLVLFSCRDKKISQTINEKDKSTSISEKERPLTSDSPTQVLQFIRGTCRGNCPAFEFYIFDDQTVLLKGIRSIDQIGWHIAKLNETEYQDIVKYVQSVPSEQFIEYSEQVMDLPHKSLECNFSGKRLKTWGNKGFPESISMVFKFLDAQIVDAKWTKLEEQDQATLKRYGQWQDEIIVQLKSSASIEDFLKPMIQFDAKLLKKIAPNMPYYLIQFNPKKVNPRSMLVMCKENENVIEAQFNQDVSARE